MTLSINRGFRLVSACPYQYTIGRMAFDANVVGADVDAEPRGFAGEHVGIGPWTAAEDSAPGAAQPPCNESMLEANDRVDLSLPR